MKECNCADFPFQPNPPCFSNCAGRIITYASPTDLLEIFEIPESIVDKFYDVKLEGTAASLEDYTDAGGLDAGEKGIINNIFLNLSGNPKAIDWLKQHMKNRELATVSV